MSHINLNPVITIPEDVFLKYVIPFLTHQTVFNILNLLSKPSHQFITSNKKSIELILWNGAKPPWAIQYGWTFTHLNQMHYNILHGKGIVRTLKRKLHNDKIVGLKKFSNSTYVSVCFSGSVQIFSKEINHLSQELSIDTKSIAQNYVQSFTSCAILKKESLIPQYFVCGAKNGSIVIWPFDNSSSSTMTGINNLLLKGFVKKISDVHIRSMSSIPNNEKELFIADGHGVVRLVEILKDHVHCKIKYTWNPFDDDDDDKKNKNNNNNNMMKDKNPREQYQYAITCMRTLENRMVCCTKKKGLYVFDKMGTCNNNKKKMQSNIINQKKIWKKKRLFNHHERFINDRNISCLEFLTPNIVVIGTRGASMTGSNSLILNLLKDECVFAVNLEMEEIIWSLPVRRSVSTVIPLKPNIVM